MTDAIDSFPPTPTQEAMLATALRHPRRGVDVEQLVVRFGERIDAGRLRAAFVSAQARFDCLRSSFRWEGVRTEQRVFACAELPFELLVHDEGTSDDEALEDFLAKDRERGFDPTVAPLFRVALLRGREDVLVFVFHHAILDGRSYRAVLEHVLDQLDGRELPAATRGPSFGDYCRQLASHDFGTSRAYFAGLLAGASTTPLPLRPGVPREEIEDGRGRKETVLHLGDIRALAALGEAHGPSVANAIQAAWAWVLSRSGGTDDVLFGTTRAGRVPWIAEVDRVVGCLIDTLPLRIRVDERESPRALLDRVHALNRALRDHEHVPLTEVLAQARVALSSFVVVERYDLGPTFRTRAGADARRGFSLRERSDVPLLLAAYQDETRLRVVLEHDERELASSEALRCLGRVARALEHFGSGTDRPLAELDLFVDDEEARIRAFSRGPAYGADAIATTVPARLEAAGRTHAEAVAVLDAAGRTTRYGALEADAARVARALAAEGRRASEVVFVLVSRSPSWIAATWGIWRLGAVYLPLDPAWPDARIAQVFADVVASTGDERPVVVVDASTRHRAERALAEARHVDLDTLAEPSTSSRLPIAPPPVSPDPDALAYLLFTSGTTGKPKGVRIPHRALAAHAQAAIEAFGLSPSDRVLQFTALGFDVSLEEVFPTLLAGATVVLRGENAANDLDAFLDEVERARITVLNLPAAFLHELTLHLQRTRRRLPASTRLLLIGGERASPESFARFDALHPEVRILNAYGPTEVTITSVVCDLRAAGIPADSRTELPIGRAFGTCRANVVALPLGTHDETESFSGASTDGRPRQARLAAIGEPGELWLSGPQVADGYLARPDATAHAFVPDPFADPDEAPRLAYRTGDRVVRNENGELLFLGRIDRQIKLRGHRIEPSEIEDALVRLDGVRSAAVVVAGEAESRTLVAFVTATASSLDAAAIRVALARTLPSSMVPSVVVPIDALPTTPSGKLDREELRLRAERAVRDAPMTERAAEPLDDLEAWLMPIFAELLHRDRIDADRSFFELGGHSLLAMRLLSRLRAERPDLPLTLAGLFANPSVRELARSLADLRRHEVPTLVRLNPRTPHVDHELPLFCVCGVQLYAALARAMQNDRPVYGAYLPVETEAWSDPHATLDVASMAASYIELLRRERPHGPYLLGGVSFGGLLAYEMAQQLCAQGEEVRLVALFDAILPRAFERAGLLERARLHARRFREGRDDLRSALRRRADRLRRRLGALAGSTAANASPEAIRDEAFKNAGEAYDPVARPYGGRALVFRAREGLGFEGENVRWDLGWSSLLRVDTPVHGIDGDHLGILKEPGASQIARVLRSEFARRDER